mmetsp:Transcript_13906/g.32584  ORF Transcript_13906/g.32584 Transcript_13906/m.32584 type:complete len:122 (+) Transcript_13906:80-445(+)
MARHAAVHAYLLLSVLALTPGRAMDLERMRSSSAAFLSDTIHALNESHPNRTNVTETTDGDTPGMNQSELPDRHRNHETVTEDWLCEYGNCSTPGPNTTRSAATCAAPVATVLALAVRMAF